MTVCANRSDNPGFFTPCRQRPCGKEVEAELAAQQANQTDTTEETP